jgi:hypothetical protein
MRLAGPLVVSHYQLGNAHFPPPIAQIARLTETVLIGIGPHGGGAVVVMCDRQLGGHQPLPKPLV